MDPTCPVQRRLLNLLTVLSLLLAVAAAVVWVLSHYPVDLSVGHFGNFPFGRGREYAADEFSIESDRYGYAAWARRGGVHFYWQELRSPQRPLTVGSMYAEVPQTVLGFGLHRAPDGLGPGGQKPWARQGTLRIPLWFVLSLLTALPAWSMLRSYRARRARRRKERGLCGACGYDVRASPGRCPECGAAVEEAR